MNLEVKKNVLATHKPELVGWLDQLYVSFTSKKYQFTNCELYFCFFFSHFEKLYPEKAKCFFLSYLTFLLHSNSFQVMHKLQSSAFNLSILFKQTINKGRKSRSQAHLEIKNQKQWHALKFLSQIGIICGHAMNFVLAKLIAKVGDKECELLGNSTVGTQEIDEGFSSSCDVRSP